MTASAAARPAEESALRADGVTVRYGDRPVLEDVHLDLQSGRTLALLGPNGSGKSTLLRVLALLERPDAGRLMLLGEPVSYQGSARLALRRRIATVFQAPLLTDATVAENVALGLGFRGVTGSGATARVTRWLERFGIGHLARRRARTLSGGEAQRASLARAFVVEPELLFLDEPFASLDLYGREVLALELEAILRESRIATVLVTHERAEAMMLGDEMAVLLGGRLAQQGATREVLSHPVSEPVARFLGVENLLPTRIEHRQGDRGEVQVAGQRFAVGLSPAVGNDALLCLRAEDVHLSPPGTPPESGSVRVSARVVRMVPYGVPWRIHLDGGVPLVALAAQRTVERLQLKSGMELVASFDPARVHVVAGRTGAVG
ncbi:MAG: ABC transporter ATP-binding protein [Gemmatimonadota bacterium]